MAEPLALPLHEVPGVQAVVVPTLLVRCRGLGSLSEADQATGSVLPTLLALHPWHQMARPRVERRSPQESQPAQHTVHLASGVTRMEDVRMLKVVFLASFKKESVIVALQESITKMN